MTQQPTIRHKPPARETWVGHPWKRIEFLTFPLRYLLVWVGVGLLYTGLPDLDWLVGGLTGLVLVAVAVFNTWGEDYTQSMQLHLRLSAVWATAFMFWGSFGFAWSYDRLRVLTLLLGALPPLAFWLSWHTVRIGQIAHQFRRYQAWELAHRPAGAIASGLSKRERTEQEAFWEDLFADLGAKDVEYVDQWLNREGVRFVRMRLPRNGKVPFGSVVNQGEGVAIAMSHRGQQISPTAVTIRRFRDGTGRESTTDFIVMLDMVNILSKLRWMTEDHTPTTIKKAFCIGVMADGRKLYMTIPEIHWAIVALTRHGKSNLLHVIIYHVSRCTDAVIWGIDMKGGSTFKPWLRPWIEQAINPLTGQPVARPVIDWLATDKYEAERMMRAFLAIAKDRPRRRFGNKTEVSRKRPHILLLVDEVSFLTGSHSNDDDGPHSTVFGSLFTKIAAIGAGEACTCVYANQRNTVDSALPGNAQANFEGKICMGAKNVQDAKMVLDNNPISAQAAAALDPDIKGTLLLAVGSKDDAYGARALFMGDHRELDRRTYEAGMYHGDIVPGIDEDEFALAIANQYGYGTRWDPQRVGWYSMSTKGEWTGVPLLESEQADPATVAATAAHTNAAAAASSTTGYFNAPPVDGYEPPPPPPGGYDPKVIPAIHQAGELAEKARKYDELMAQQQGGSPDRAAFDAIVAQDEELRTLPGDVAGLVAALDEAADGGGPAPAAQPGDDQRVRFILDFVFRKGTKGAMSGDIIAAMIEAGMLTEKGKSAIYRYMPQAMDEVKWGDMALVQPNGKKTRYYTLRHVRASQRGE